MLVRTLRNYPDYEITTNGDVINKSTGKILKERADKYGFGLVLLYKTAGLKIREWCKVQFLLFDTFTPYEIENGKTQDDEDDYFMIEQ